MRAALIALLLSAACPAWSSSPPAAAALYQRDVTREARAAFGISAPIALLAGQIHQESSWRADARSPYAAGLAQFTPATADWISAAYRLGIPDAYNPRWAIRAMATYDRHIYDRQALPAATDCDRWAFVLAGYNGGPGWLPRDRALCAAAAGCDPSRWWGHVERHTGRADWARRENRAYPRRIMQHQHLYVGWGPVLECAP